MTAGNISLDNFRSTCRLRVGETDLTGFISKQNVANFLGIPFAKVAARFRTARRIDLEDLHGDVDATRYGPRCPQKVDTIHPIMCNVFEKLSTEQRTDEDTCLHLNVYAPLEGTVKSNAEKIPVFVWIHGGGFNNGDNTTEFDGNHLVQRSMELGKPIIIVTFNYRLNLFGFSASLELIEEAKSLGETPVMNQGLNDQRLGLQWVQSSIQYFGGDASNVTLGGESAGAASVLYQIRGGQPLFRQALIQSTPRLRLGTLKESQAAFDKLVRSAASQRMHRALKSSQLYGQCPQRESSSYLMAQFQHRWKIQPAEWCPQVVLGCTKDEAALFFMNMTHSNEGQIVDFLRSIVPDAPVATIFPGGKPTLQALIEWMTNDVFTHPTLELAAKVIENGPKLFLYTIDLVDPFPGPLHGYAWHSFGVPLTFYQPPGRVYPRFQVTQEKMSASYINFFYGLEPWEPYRAAGRQMSWNGERTGVVNVKPSIVEDSGDNEILSIPQPPTGSPENRVTNQHDLFGDHFNDTKIYSSTGKMASNPPQGSMGKTVLVSLAVMCGSFTFGIESGTIAGFQAMEPWLKDYGYYDASLGAWNIHTNIQTAVGGVVLGGAVLGSIVSGPLGSRFGRRPGLFAIGVSAILGAIFQIVYPSLGLLLLGRVMQGVAIGLASNFVTVYQSEVAPTQYRGIMISLYQLGINIGGLIGTCINEGTHSMTTRWSYRIPLLTSLFFPTLLIIVTIFLPESPRWFLSVGRTDEAFKSIQRLRGKEYPLSQVQSDIDDIAQHIALERELEASSSYLDLFKGTDKRRTGIVVGVLLFQVLSGITFINSYGTYFFQVSGISNVFVVTVIASVCQLSGLLVMYPTMRFMGRRAILLWGAAAEAVCLFTIAIVDVAAPGSNAAAKCLVAFTCLFGFFFTWSWGAVGWVVASEASSTTLRSKTQSVGTAASWAMTVVISVVVPYLINPTAANLGGKVGFIFGGLTIIAFIWAYFYLPETGGRSLEELDELFLDRIPARRFKSYKSSGLEHFANHTASAVIGDKKGILIVQHEDKEYPV
ncbi:hypothetical protein G7Y89_g8410 [Cudoniella acicularis]|uniref:Major facilitator superfamily (MFS) profile domain-containing protein n=1 Tax=Cudoniella acicularis TaxID=354080 RepID=A0A8H4RGN8_9HELO|nr:hypothetical protein G7Y89_g8410 [Cudoniella acicularis]